MEEELTLDRNVYRAITTTSTITATVRSKVIVIYEKQNQSIHFITSLATSKLLLMYILMHLYTDFITSTIQLASGLEPIYKYYF